MPSKTPILDEIKAENERALLDFTAYADSLMKDASMLYDLVGLLEELKGCASRGVRNNQVIEALQGLGR